MKEILRVCTRLCVFVGVLSCLFERTSAQAIVPDSVCEANRLTCPTSSNKAYETYCCLIHDNYRPALYCCNPYVGLYIGLGVGIPLLLGIVVVVVLLYLCWTCFHQKRMRHLRRIYVAQTTQAASANLDNEAPPAYTTVDEDKVEDCNRLPMYSADDPYPDASNPPPNYVGGEEDGRSVESEEVVTDDLPLIRRETD